MYRSVLIVIVAALCLLMAPPAHAQNAPPRGAMAPGVAGAGKAPAPYASFVSDAKVAPGLFPIIDKDGTYYLEVKVSQLGQDFIATSVPATGLGGFGPAPGEPYVAPARIIHFERHGDSVVLRWPNTIARTAANTPEREGAEQSLPSSVIAVVPIAAADDTRVVIPASAFLGDVGNLAATLNFGVSPMHAYRLDPTKSFFDKMKAFPDNDVLRVDQTWTAGDPGDLDNAPDPRNVEVKMTYNLIAAPNNGYVPRIADPRVGFFSQGLLNFGTDDEMRRDIHYITRWNFGARASNAPFNATNPIVFYLSNDIPVEYRDVVAKGLLTWNDAFAKVGILNAVKVEQQPSDPSWDAEDIRHNVVRWFDSSLPQYGAEALLVTDPRSGEEINIGVNFDAVMGLSGRNIYKYAIAPARGLPDTVAAERAYAESFIRSIVLHESGHDMGLQHNFIGSMAYTAQQIQNKSFTEKYGIANSVMEYNPLNLWPKNTPQGAYDQLVLGPYDYYAIQYGYGYISNAATPEQELPTLNRWASRWMDPKYRFASDEDADTFANGHSVDPRVVTYDLTNHPLAWCKTQMTLMHSLMDAVNARFPQAGLPYDQARLAFLQPLRYDLRCAAMPAHTIGGEYLSRSQKGDPGSGAPLQAIPRAEQRAAWEQLSNGLFADAPWRFNPKVLNMLTYSEVSSLNQDGSWSYNPPARHDVSVVGAVNAAQINVLRELFAPLRLQRIDEASTKYGSGATMSLTDLYDWSRSSIFGSIINGTAANDGVIHRNLQTMYATMLASMLTAPERGTPSDAQGLARVNLERLRTDASTALHNGRLDDLTRGHLEALQAIAEQALNAHAIVR